MNIVGRRGIGQYRIVDGCGAVKGGVDPLAWSAFGHCSWIVEGLLLVMGLVGLVVGVFCRWTEEMGLISAFEQGVMGGLSRWKRWPQR